MARYITMAEKQGQLPFDWPPTDLPMYPDPDMYTMRHAITGAIKPPTDDDNDSDDNDWVVVPRQEGIYDPWVSQWMWNSVTQQTCQQWERYGACHKHLNANCWFNHPPNLHMRTTCAHDHEVRWMTYADPPRKQCSECGMVFSGISDSRDGRRWYSCFLCADWCYRNRICRYGAHSHTHYNNEPWLYVICHLCHPDQGQRQLPARYQHSFSSWQDDSSSNSSWTLSTWSGYRQG